MIRADLAYIYNFSKNFDRIRWIDTNSEYESSIKALLDVKLIVKEFLYRSIYSMSLLACEKSFRDFDQTIENILQKGKFSEHDVLELRGSIYNLDVTIQSTLASCPVFTPSIKGAFNPDILISIPALAFPEELLQRVPLVKNDVEEAAKSLAFEMPTSAAFHLFRILEAVLRESYQGLISNTSKEETKTTITEESLTIGKCIHLMEKKNIGDKKLLAVLKQIKELHRNPAIHPDSETPLEGAYEMDEAFALFGIINSVLYYLLREIPKII